MGSETAGEELADQQAELRECLRSLLPGTFPWFTFFTSGFLHVFDQFLACFPVARHSSLLVITAGLTLDEQAAMSEGWNGASLTIPHHVDSKGVYELLYRELRQPFGWIDVDCFLSNPDVLDEIERNVLDGASFCGPLSYGPIPILAAPLMGSNPGVIEATEMYVGGKTSPNAYSYASRAIGRDAHGLENRIVEEFQRDALQQIMQFEGTDMPFPQGGILDVYDGVPGTMRSHERFYHKAKGRRIVDVVFDGLVMLQLMSHASGAPPVRCQRSYAGSKVFSSDLVHAGGISYWQTYYREVLEKRGEALPWSAHIDSLLLTRYALSANCPPAYGEMAARLGVSLSEVGYGDRRLRGDLAAQFTKVGLDPTETRWDRLFHG